MGNLIKTQNVKLDTRYTPTDLVDIIDFWTDGERIDKYELENGDVFMLLDWPNDEDGWHPAVVWPNRYRGAFLTGQVRLNNSLVVIEVEA